MPARVGSFQGPTVTYGTPTSTVHPIDNQLTPDPTLAASEQLQANAEQLLADIQNTLRNARPKTP